MQNNSVSFVLQWGVRIAIWILLFTPLIISSTWFFPYITGKNFFFRIVTELAFGMWLALIFVDARFRPRRGIIVWTFLAFMVVLVIAGIFGADLYHSFWSNYERMEGLITYLHMATLFLMASTVFRSLFDWRSTLHVSVAVSVIVALYGLFELLGIITIPGSTAGESGIGIFSRLGNQIYLAAYLLFHFFILAFLFFTTRNLWWRVAYVAIIFFEFYIFIHTGTRGALVGLLIGTVVSLGTLFIFSLRDNKRLAFYLGSILFLGVMSMGGLFLTRDTEFVKQYPLLERFADIRTTSSTAQSRFMIWGIAWDAFKERPILGWGPGNFIIPYAKYYNPNLYGNEPWFDRVHNMHLEWLVAGGIIGFLAYISVIGSVLITLWQLWYKHIMSGVAVVTLLGFLVAYLGQNTFVFDNVVTYIFFTLLLALVQSLYTPVPKEEEHSVQKQSRVLVIAPVFIVLGVTASITHVQQMQVAGGIIDMLNSVGTGNTVHSMTRQLDDLKEKNTFGTTEVRERFVDFLFAATRPSAEIPASDLLFLLSRGIEEMNEEIARSPENTKHRISLGKLLQLRFSLTRNEADYDEAVRVYEETIQQAPHFPPAYIGLAEVYLTVGNTARAMDFMDTIFNEMTRPSQLFVHSLLLVDVLSGDYDGGVAHIERYLSLGNTQSYPRDATFDHTRTTDLIQRVEAVGGDARSREGFLEAYQPGLAGWRDHEVFLRSLANIKAELGKKEEARELAQMIITANPDRGPEVEVFLRSLDAL